MIPSGKTSPTPQLAAASGKYKIGTKACMLATPLTLLNIEHEACKVPRFQDLG